MRWVIAALAGAALGGCGSSSAERAVSPRVVSSSASVFVEPEGWVFAAAAARVHPLTHVRVDAAGRETLVVLHVESTDAWDDPVKSLGQLEVSLVWPGGEAGEVRWAHDLTEPGVNARYWERITRTYRVFLGQLPPDAMAALTREGADRPRAVLRLTFRTHDDRGEVLVLRDEFELGDS